MCSWGKIMPAALGFTGPRVVMSSGIACVSFRVPEAYTVSSHLANWRRACRSSDDQRHRQQDLGGARPCGVPFQACQQQLRRTLPHLVSRLGGYGEERIDDQAQRQVVEGDHGESLWNPDIHFPECFQNTDGSTCTDFRCIVLCIYDGIITI